MFGKKEYVFSQVTTRGGDKGYSTDFSGNSFLKDSLIFETVGEIDSLSSWLGIIKHNLKCKSKIEHYQLLLQHIMSLVATSPNFNIQWEPTNEIYLKMYQVSQDDTLEIEKHEQSILDKGLKIEPKFVLPGATVSSSYIDVARATCRKAERVFVRFMREENRPDLRNCSIFLNRLSDLLFIIKLAVEQKLEI